MKRILLAALILGLSCGAADGDEPVDMSPQGVCAFYAERDCARYEQCELPNLRYYYNDVALCRERTALRCISRLTATGSNETPSGIVACAKALHALSCESYRDFDRWPAACSIPPGQLPDGAGCIVSGQCEGGHCAYDTPQCGVCMTVSRAGGACATDVHCLNAMPCVDGICVPHPKLGEPCNETARACIFGLVCRNIGESGLGTCEMPLPSGSPCELQPSGLHHCDYSQFYTCDDSRTCQPARYRPALIGESCHPGQCNFVSDCGAGGVCRAKGREGEPCSEDVIDCITPARCIGGICKIRDAAVCK